MADWALLGSLRIPSSTPTQKITRTTLYKTHTRNTIGRLTTHLLIALRMIRCQPRYLMCSPLSSLRITRHMHMLLRGASDTQQHCAAAVQSNSLQGYGYPLVRHSSIVFPYGSTRPQLPQYRLCHTESSVYKMLRTERKRSGNGRNKICKSRETRPRQYIGKSTGICTPNI